MRVKVVTLSCAPSLGGFDERPLSVFVRDKEILAVREHFFCVHDLPHLACLITYQEPTVHAGGAEGAAPASEKGPGRRKGRDLSEILDGLPPADWRVAPGGQDLHHSGPDPEPWRHLMRSISLLVLLLSLAFLPLGCGDGKDDDEGPPKPDFVHQPSEIRPVPPERLVEDEVTGRLVARGEALVGLADGRTRADLEAELATLPFQAQVVGWVPDFEVYQVSYGEPDDDEAQRAIDGLSAALYAMPNGYLEAIREFDDPALKDGDEENDWGLRMIGAAKAWDMTLGDDVLVAVIDDGVDPNHPELQDRMAGTYSYATRSPEQRFDTYTKDVVYRDGTPGKVKVQVGDHGTHVAGTIAAAAGNGEGTAGVAPRARILGIQAIYYRPEKNQSYVMDGDLTDAIDRALAAGAQVINMSLGVDIPDKIKKLLADPSTRQPVLDRILKGRDKAMLHYGRILAKVRSRGVVAIASAGNNDLPANWGALASMPETIGVGASTPEEGRADFSSYQEGSGRRVVDLSAPGTKIYSSSISEKYRSMQGTSMAAPHVSGAAALLKAVAPSASPEEIREVLVSTAKSIRTDRDIGPRLDAAAAVAEMQKRRSTRTPPPTLRPTPPPRSPVMPPAVRWTGQPGQIIVVIRLGPGGGWIGDLIRYLIGYFFRAMQPRWPGRFDEYGRYVNPPGIVAVGPPADLGGRDRFTYLWETRRGTRSRDGKTLESYVVGEVDRSVKKAIDERGGDVEQPDTPRTGDADPFLEKLDEILAIGTLKNVDMNALYRHVQGDAACVPGGVTLLGVDQEPEKQTVKEEHLAKVRELLARSKAEIDAIHVGVQRNAFPQPFPASLAPWARLLMIAHAYMENAVRGNGKAYELKARVILERLNEQPRTYLVVKSLWKQVVPSGGVAEREAGMGFNWQAVR